MEERAFGLLISTPFASILLQMQKVSLSNVYCTITLDQKLQGTRGKNSSFGSILNELNRFVCMVNGRENIAGGF